MKRTDINFMANYKSDKELQKYAENALLLYALKLYYGIEDIDTVASESITGYPGDKKTDLIYIDTDRGNIVIAQTTINNSKKKKYQAPANKASDLNTSVGWLLLRNIDDPDFPERLKASAKELRRALNAGEIETMNLWYVHDFPESKNVKSELKTVEHTAKSAIKSKFESQNVSIKACEVGIDTLEQWYKNITTPIIVSDSFTLNVPGGYSMKGKNWKAYVTSIRAGKLYQLYKKHKTDLFSANVREYMGSRKSDKNINNRIKETGEKQPEQFWAFNNGITALVNDFTENTKSKKKSVTIDGFSIVNGAQTTGALGSLKRKPSDSAMVPVRFIKCTSQKTIRNIVLYNNSQNRLKAADFRSRDDVQRRLKKEFNKMPDIDYSGRRGGFEDVIRRNPNLLSSETASQSLAAFHGDPKVAYHQKTKTWEKDSLYQKYFNSHTTASHVFLTFSLLKTIEEIKLNLFKKNKIGKRLKEEEIKQLDFLRLRGSTYLLIAALAECLEIIIDKQISSRFRLSFKKKEKLSSAIKKWYPIVNIGLSFSEQLANGLSDGLKNTKAVDTATSNFKSLLSATKQANQLIFRDFAKDILYR